MIIDRLNNSVRMDNPDGNDSGNYTTSIALPSVWQKQLRELAINEAAQTKQFVCIADLIRRAIAKEFGFTLEGR